MTNDRFHSLRTLLVSVLPEGKLASTEIDALMRYISDVTRTEEEAIQRLSRIVHTDLGGVHSLKTAMQVESLGEKVADLNTRMKDLEKKPSDNGQLKVVQAIFISISFVASTIALLKAFGFLSFPWVKP